MIVDSSAVIAILFDEPEATAFIDMIHMATACHMSAANALEAAMVIDRRESVSLTRHYDRFMEVANIQIAPVTTEDVSFARHAYHQFGKGKHRAALNFGDCFAYALAKRLGLPLLFKGNDFIHTDIVSAVATLNTPH
ncbi:MAG: type II toxin-antitoxin system VapC family toxin [Chloroflexota bacterium]